MEKGFKYRAYPTKIQKAKIDSAFNCCRFVYNYYLHKRIFEYDNNMRIFGYNDCSRDLTQLKKEYAWLKQTDSTALQSSIRNLDTAFKRYDAGVSELPRFKKKRNLRSSYTSKCVNGNITFSPGWVKLPKVGMIKVKGNVNPNGRILSATVSRDIFGKYYVSLCCTDVVMPEFKETESTAAVTLDEDKIIVNGNEECDFSSVTNVFTARKKKIEEAMSRKPKDSSKCFKLRLKLLKYYNRMKNRIVHLLHVLSFGLSSKNKVLNIKCSSLGIWTREFLRQLRYKTLWYGRKLNVEIAGETTV